MGLTIGNYIGIGKNSGISWQSYWTKHKFAEIYSKIFGSHIIANWVLDEAAGVTAQDASINDCDATYVGTVSLNQASFHNEKCVDFAGTGDVNINSVNLAALMNMSEGYMSVWVNVLDDTTWNTADLFFFNIYADGDNRFQLSTSATGGLSAYYKAGGAELTVSCDTPQSNKAYNVGVGWSKTANKLSLFINGLEVATGSGITQDWVGGLGVYHSFFAPGWGGGRLNCKGSNILILDYFPSYADICKSVLPVGLIGLEGDSRSTFKGWISDAVEVASSNLIYGQSKMAVRPFAVSGANTQDIIARQSATNAGIKVSGLNNVLVVWCGVNSAVNGAALIFADLKAYCIAAKLVWSKVILCTEIDAQDSMDWHNTVYPALNALIAADHDFVDAVADLGARTELQDAADTTYYNADKVHLTDAGYAVVAQVVGAALASVL